MSKVAYKWSSSAPTAPDIYMTRRNESKYLTLRYWDGSGWFQLAWSNSRGGTRFEWPKPSISKRPRHWNNNKMYIRKISANIGAIQWGEPFKVFDEKEVLAYLVKTNVLPVDWRIAYQDAMRNTA